MTYTKFLTGVTGYYGDYNPIVENVVMKYIQGKFQESELNEVFKKLVMNLESKYKTPPDVAEFERIFALDKNDVERDGNLAWIEVNKNINSNADAVIENPIIQTVIENMGGWIGFCSRPNDHQSEVWNRKRFIELYAMYQGQELTTKVLRGRVSLAGGRSQTIMIGNPQNCQNILEMAKQENKNYLELSKKLKESKKNELD